MFLIMIKTSQESDSPIGKRVGKKAIPRSENMQ